MGRSETCSCKDQKRNIAPESHCAYLCVNIKSYILSKSMLKHCCLLHVIISTTTSACLQKIKKNLCEKHLSYQSLRLLLPRSFESRVLTSQALHLCPTAHDLLCSIILTSWTVLAAYNTETRTFTHEPRVLSQPDHRGILEMGTERPVAQFLFWPLSDYYPHSPAARKMVAVWK